MTEPAPIDEVQLRLRQQYPEARYELDWSTPWELLVATILAARCTDERVNRVTKTLFTDYPEPAAYAAADLADLEQAVRPTGAYKTKAKAVQACARAVLDQFDGQVPRTMEQLVTLPGVARKTANVVLATAFGIAEGIIVDVHVARVSRRMGLTTQTKGERIEKDLMQALPREDWTHFGPAMVLLGRYVCTARAPQCGECIMEPLCPQLEA
ncbi:MAG: endonuclease III [Deltaproteobacteria bacterium]|nr:endonuclease III [Deltaproteobacteria bacterium]